MILFLSAKNIPDNQKQYFWKSQIMSLKIHWIFLHNIKEQTSSESKFCCLMSLILSKIFYHRWLAVIISYSNNRIRKSLMINSSTFSFSMTSSYKKKKRKKKLKSLLRIVQPDVCERVDIERRSKKNHFTSFKPTFVCRLWMYFSIRNKREKKESKEAWKITSRSFSLECASAKNWFFFLLIVRTSLRYFDLLRNSNFFIFSVHHL